MKDTAPSEGTSSAAAEHEARLALRRFQRLVVRYPFAAQAMFSSVVEEGREFAKTDAGQHWAERLQSTALLRQGRAVWEALTLNALEPEPDAILPSKFIEAFLRAAERPDLEAFLRSVLQPDAVDPAASAAQNTGGSPFRRETGAEATHSQAKE